MLSLGLGTPPLTTFQSLEPLNAEQLVVRLPLSEVVYIPASPLPLSVTFPEAFDLSIAVVPVLLAIQCQHCAHKSLKGKNPAAYLHGNYETSYLRGMRFVAFLLFFFLNLFYPSNRTWIFQGLWEEACPWGALSRRQQSDSAIPSPTLTASFQIGFLK